MSFASKFIVILIAFIGTIYADADSDRKLNKLAPRWGDEPVINNYGDPMIAAIVQDGVKINRENLYMWSAYYVYKETDTHCYLGIPIEGDLPLEKRIGWVEKEYLLINFEALRTPYKIFRKAIVFDNKYENRIPVYDAPNNDAQEIGKTPLFTFFYIYKDIGDYYLIGLSPNVDLEYCSDEILGWIHKKTCREWNTRQAVGHERINRWLRIEQQRKESNGLVNIYKDIETAMQLNVNNVVNQEAESTTWQYNMPRYPLLESNSIEGKRLFNIAFLGGEKGTFIQETISRVKEARERLSKVDVIFLVDASTIQTHRQQIKNAITNAIVDMKKSQDDKDKVVDLNFGLIYYSDFSEWGTYRYQRGKIFQPQVVRLYNLTDNINYFERGFKIPHFFGKKDEVKSLFYGIDTAMNRVVRWREGSTRNIIVMGYSGNHAAESKDKKNVSGLEVKDIVEELKINNIDLYGIQLPHDIENNKNSDSFVTQLTEITKGVGSGGVFPAWNFTEGDIQGTMTEVLGLLFKGVKQKIRLEQQMIGDLEHGLILEEINKRHHDKWEDFNEKLQKSFFKVYIQAKAVNSLLKTSPAIFHHDTSVLNQIFIDAEKIPIEDFKGNDVAYDKGWAWEYHPKTNIRQMQVYLLMNKMELSRLLGFLSALLQELEQASKPEQYLEIWKTLLKTTLGIDSVPASEPLDSLIKQHTGLPFMNGLLSYTLDDFVEKARDPGFRRELLSSLSENTNRLFEVLSENEKEKIKSTEGVLEIKERKRWWKERENEMEYAWIEIELFP